MLVLTRKPGEKIHIGGAIIVTILEINGTKVRIGIEAPDDVIILRAELRDLVGAGASAGDESVRASR